MYIIDLSTKDIMNEFNKNFYKKGNSYIILSTPDELNLLQEPLDIDQDTLEDCLEFDENTKLDLFDKYDFLSLNTCELIEKKAIIKEVNLYLSDCFIVVVVEENHFIYNYVKNMITKNLELEKSSTVTLFKINYSIIKEVILVGFETLDKVEDLILKIEDGMMDKVCSDHIEDINYIRGITRTIVKNTRPLLYIGDRILKENIRYLKHSDVKKYNLENFQDIDFGIDKLYTFAISTRELADKLLDIYSSRVGEKTNSLITKLTLLTAISTPLTVITGIYGMNFRYMPELDFVFAYPLTLLFMLMIILIGIIIFKIKKIL
ncbi:cation transporter [Romboutsia weinsteinii]|uniref:Cation transporter n=1 Tax=Romboutsia weinsteinii TaxID=2020949 RepID=A0A371J6F6_9FIRM|nr:CorA family divalent cation transporter [Romboutsia weinsteinii]RDY28325.1 cation transporter [Romboutsia weinsteinii]